MINFFRKIRKQLADDNKPIKYFRYAIGEIVLVVIGILIALSINNWNENRKTIAKVDQILKSAHDELVFNINSSQSLINYYREIEKYFYTILHEKATLEDYKTNKLTYLIWGTTAVGVSDNAANKLEGISDELTSDQDSLISQINKFYNSFKIRLDKFDEEISESSELFDLRLRNNTDWYYLDNLDKGLPERAYQYFLNNPSYLNDVSHYEVIGLQNHLSETISFITRGRDLYIDLATYLNLEIDSKIVSKIANFKHYIGTYKLDDTTYIIREDNGKLVYDWERNENSGSRSLYPKNEDEFIISFRFGKLNRNDKNEVIGFTLTRGSQEPKHYIKIE